MIIMSNILSFDKIFDGKIKTRIQNSLVFSVFQQGLMLRPF